LSKKNPKTFEGKNLGDRTKSYSLLSNPSIR